MKSKRVSSGILIYNCTLFVVSVPNVERFVFLSKLNIDFLTILNNILQKCVPKFDDGKMKKNGIDFNHKMYF